MPPRAPHRRASAPKAVYGTRAALNEAVRAYCERELERALNRRRRRLWPDEKPRPGSEHAVPSWQERLTTVRNRLRAVDHIRFQRGRGRPPDERARLVFMLERYDLFQIGRPCSQTELAMLWLLVHGVAQKDVGGDLTVQDLIEAEAQTMKKYLQRHGQPAREEVVAPELGEREIVLKNADGSIRERAWLRRVGRPRRG
jgi:hypothetical protein